MNLIKKLSKVPIDYIAVNLTKTVLMLGNPELTDDEALEMAVDAYKINQSKYCKNCGNELAVDDKTFCSKICTDDYNETIKFLRSLFVFSGEKK